MRIQWLDRLGSLVAAWKSEWRNLQQVPPQPHRVSRTNITNAPANTHQALTQMESEASLGMQLDEEQARGASRERRYAALRATSQQPQMQ
jgi:hypothetical protein